jgi:hypothetical protein
MKQKTHPIFELGCSLLQTLIRRDRFQAPQRTSLYLRTLPDIRHAGGKGWTVFITKDVR